MRSLFVVFAFLGSTGCNLPSMDFRNVAAQRVSVDGSTFDVRVLGNRAEAIRVNPAYAPRMGPNGGRAASAMARASGCRVVSVSGDQAQVFGRLDCGDGPPPIPRKSRELECYPLRGTEIYEIGQIRVDLECD